MHHQSHLATQPTQPDRAHSLLTRLSGFATLGLALVSLGSAASAQGNPSDAADVFDPLGRVPLSQFAMTEPASGSPQTIPDVHLQVLPELLNALVPTGVDPLTRIKVTRLGPQGYVTNQDAFSVDLITGDVVYKPGLAEAGSRYVATTRTLTNDLPSVTHWDENANAGRGGQSLGATDGISTTFLDTVNQELSGTLTTPGVNIVSGDATWGNATGQLYHYNSQDLALFSDGSGTHLTQPVPGYERYVAENWSTTRFTEEATLWMSDQARADTGWPIVHINYDSTNVALGTYAKQSIPAFQFIHNYIVPFDNGDSTDGREESLAGILLPPFWKKNPTVRTEGYPVLFSSLYDINELVQGQLAATAGILGTLFNDDGGRQAVAIFWNGGGAEPTYVSNASAFKNMNLLMDKCVEAFSIDQKALVVTGGSRGGGAASLVASNPTAHAYEVRFLSMAGPESNLGEAVADFTNPTHFLLHFATKSLTGYRKGFTDGFIDSTTGLSGHSLALMTFFGTDNEALISGAGTQTEGLVANSNRYVNELATQNPEIEVILTSSTNDHSQPFFFNADYYERLKAHPANIPLRWEIFYGLGHGVDQPYDTPSRYEMISKVFDDESLDAQDLGIFEFSVDPNNPSQLIETKNAAHGQVAVEGPIRQSPGQEATWTVTGPPGTNYTITFYKIRAADLAAGTLTPSDVNQCDPPISGVPSHCPLVVTGTLPDNLNGDRFASATVDTTGSPFFTLDEEIDPFDNLPYDGVYLYDLSYDIPGFPSCSAQNQTSGATFPLSFTTPAGYSSPFVFIVANEKVGLQLPGGVTGGMVTDCN